MTGPAFSGWLPKDVARLPWWTLKNDFVEPLCKMAAKFSMNREEHEPLMELPSREVHVGLMAAEHPDWTPEQLNAHYDEMARQWKAAEAEEENEQ